MTGVLQLSGPAAGFSTAPLIRACFKVGPYGDSGPTGSCFFFPKVGFSLCRGAAIEEINHKMYERGLSPAKISFLQSAA